MGREHGHFKYDLVNGPMQADGVRLSLPSRYAKCIEFWKPLLKKAQEQNLLSFYTDIGKDKANNRAMVNI